MNHKVELLTCDSGDWNVLKLDGEVFASGHTILVHEWLALLIHSGIDALETKLTDKEMEELY